MKPSTDTPFQLRRIAPKSTTKHLSNTFPSGRRRCLSFLTAFKTRNLKEPAGIATNQRRTDIVQHRFNHLSLQITLKSSSWIVYLHLDVNRDTSSLPGSVERSFCGRLNSSIRIVAISFIGRLLFISCLGRGGDNC